MRIGHLAVRGVTVIYRKSRYKKKVRLVVNTAFLFKEKEYDSGKIVQQLEKRVAKYFGDRRSLEEFVLTEGCADDRFSDGISRGCFGVFASPAENWESEEFLSG